MTQNPFWHYSGRFDALETLKRYIAIAPPAKPREGFVVNFLGVAVPPSVHPAILGALAGTVDAPPLPNNWHADLAEWGAAFRAVDLSGPTFTMIELGCGWGCWMNNAGTAARLTGRKVHVIGVEGDQTHVEFAQETLAQNGFGPDESTLVRGIAAGTSGVALFPIQGEEGGWGSAPVFGATEAQVEEAVSSGSYEILDMVPLAQVTEGHDVIDLLHIDIQGGEADLIASTLDTLAEKVRYILIGTHSREIEGRLFQTLLSQGWVLDIERPAILALGDTGPYVTVDGVQGWLNPRLSPLS